jgi:hypothetical protein
MKYLQMSYIATVLGFLFCLYPSPLVEQSTLAPYNDALTSYS